MADSASLLFHKEVSFLASCVNIVGCVHWVVSFGSLQTSRIPCWMMSAAGVVHLVQLVCYDHINCDGEKKFYEILYSACFVLATAFAGYAALMFRFTETTPADEEAAEEIDDYLDDTTIPNTLYFGSKGTAVIPMLTFWLSALFWVLGAFASIYFRDAFTRVLQALLAISMVVLPAMQVAALGGFKSTDLSVILSWVTASATLLTLAIHDALRWLRRYNTNS